MKKKILIVEDELITAWDLQLQLESWGHSIIHVRTGDEAVQEAYLKKPDIIIMDVSLPGELTGIDAAEYIQELNIPIIFITGLSIPNIKKEITKDKYAGYVLKPFRGNQLKEIIDQLDF